MCFLEGLKNLVGHGGWIRVSTSGGPRERGLGNRNDL